MSKTILTNLILKNYEEYLISDLYNIFCLVKDLIFKLIRQVMFFERSDKMT